MLTESTSVPQPVFSQEALTLSLHPDDAEEGSTAGKGRAKIAYPTGKGDEAFLAECRLHLNGRLVGMAERLLSAIRERYPGNLHEGLARKWVSQPGNFVALTIQNRDQSFAVHLKGKPKDFPAPSLDIKPDRASYSRFKLKHENQLDDTIRVVLASAQRSEGY